MLRDKKESWRVVDYSWGDGSTIGLRLREERMNLMFFRYFLMRVGRRPSTSSAKTCKRCAAKVYIVMDSYNT